MTSLSKQIVPDFLSGLFQCKLCQSFLHTTNMGFKDDTLEVCKDCIENVFGPINEDIKKVLYGALKDCFQCRECNGIYYNFWLECECEYKEYFEYVSI